MGRKYEFEPVELRRINISALGTSGDVAYHVGVTQSAVCQWIASNSHGFRDLCVLRMTGHGAIVDLEAAMTWARIHRRGTYGPVA